MTLRKLGFQGFVCLNIMITAAAAHAAAPPATPAGPINPGKWEITLHTTEPIDAPPMVNVVCIGPDAIARIAPPVSRASDECKLVTPGSLNHGVLTFMMICPHLGRTTTSKTTFAGDTFSASLLIEHRDGPAFKQTTEGRRLGDCDVSQ